MTSESPSLVCFLGGDKSPSSSLWIFSMSLDTKWFLVSEYSLILNLVNAVQVKGKKSQLNNKLILLSSNFYMLRWFGTIQNNFWCTGVTGWSLNFFYALSKIKHKSGNKHCEHLHFFNYVYHCSLCFIFD